MFRKFYRVYNEEVDSICVMADFICQDQGKSAGGQRLFFFEIFTGYIIGGDVSCLNKNMQLFVFIQNQKPWQKLCIRQIKNGSFVILMALIWYVSESLNTGLSLKNG